MRLLLIASFPGLHRPLAGCGGLGTRLLYNTAINAVVCNMHTPQTRLGPRPKSTPARIASSITRVILDAIRA